jgi:hypothetical protein
MIRHNNQGLVGVIILVIASIAILSYFSIDIRGIFESDIFKNNFSYIVGGIKSIWQTYLSAPVVWIWTKLIYPFVWTPVINLIDSNATSTP